MLYNGYTYPNADETPAPNYSVSDTAPYAGACSRAVVHMTTSWAPGNPGRGGRFPPASQPPQTPHTHPTLPTRTVRVVENTIAMLNAGATALYYWCAQDMGGKTWGWVDGAGNAKPVYAALANLYPKLPPGGAILRLPGDGAPMGNDVALGVYVRNGSVVVVASNSGAIAQGAVVALAGCPPGGVRLANATAVTVAAWGVPEDGSWDAVVLGPAGGGAVGGDLAGCELALSLPPVSTLCVELELGGGGGQAD